MKSFPTFIPGGLALMSNDRSVTHWFRLVQMGDHAAAQPLWDRYFLRLQALANSKLKGRKLALADAEDVAVSAFASLCRGLERGRFPSLSDRDDLWKLLIVIAARKVSHLLRDEQCLKRGGKAALARRGQLDLAELEQVLGEEPTPEFAVQAAEECQRLLDCLGNEELRQIATWKMEGHTNSEIAELAECAPRTVDRKLKLIRHLWKQEVEL